MTNEINPKLNPLENVRVPYTPKPLPKPPSKATQKTDILATSILQDKAGAPPKEKNIRKVALGAYAKTYGKPNPSFFGELIKVVYRYLKEKLTRSAEHASSPNLPLENDEALPKSVEDEISRLQNEDFSENFEELDKLKTLISALTSKNKLRLNENSELVIKSRNLKAGGEIGVSEKSQSALNEVLNKLISLTGKDVPLSELKDLVDTLKRSGWGSVALKNDSTQQKLTTLENFIRIKMDLDHLTKEYDLVDKKLYEGYPKSEGETHASLESRWHELMSEKNASLRRFESIKKQLDALK